MSEQEQPQLAPARGALHVQLQALAQAESFGGGTARASTPLKRSRADVQQRISDDLARNSCEMPVDEVVDTMRSQKRFLSEVRKLCPAQALQQHRRLGRNQIGIAGRSVHLFVSTSDAAHVSV